MADDCIDHLNNWIVEVKKRIWDQEASSENAEGVIQYKEALTILYEKLDKAIRNEDVQELQALEWPAELMDCVKDMSIRCEILDCIRQAFTIHYFNRSPIHEEELRKENEGLE